jgi:CO/xanthine dehydrogenase FAD-binding subunit
MARSYERPKLLEEAVGILSRGTWTVLAGGTDIYPAAAEAFAWGRPAPDHILDITAIDGLNGIEETADGYRIGCRVTWSQIMEADLPGWFHCLRQAGCEVGGKQIQNRGTLVGNLCNASPAADGVPALLALDAAVEIKNLSGVRVLPLSEFILGNRKTAHDATELVTAIIVPKRGAKARSTFLKLGARRYLVVSITMVAALLETNAADCIDGAGVAVGACSEVAQRLPALEAALIGKSIYEPLEDLVETDMLMPLVPIDDIRGSAEYRRDAAFELVRGALETLRMSKEPVR